MIRDLIAWEILGHCSDSNRLFDFELGHQGHRVCLYSMSQKTRHIEPESVLEEAFLER